MPSVAPRFSLLPPSLFLLAAAVAAPALFGQRVQPASTSQGGPGGLLAAASQANGLHGENLEPWYIHGSWQIVDENKATQQGSFEEWWSSPQRAKIDVSGSGFQETRYLTPRGAVYTGTAVPPDNIVGYIGDAIGLPLPSGAAGLHQSSMTEGGVALSCVSRPSPSPGDAGPAGSLLSAYSACFAGNPPALRMEAGVAVRALFNSLVRFEDRYVARDVRFILPSGENIAVHLDVLQALSAAPDSFFAPPASAQPLPALIDLPGDVLLPTRISGHRPLYPYRARADTIQGTVVLAALIHKDGSVGDLKVVSSPPLLGQAALLGVETWRYRPYLVDGQPVEVQTRIRVSFTCNGANVCSFDDQN